MACKKPCKSCPWRVNSIQGYLGGNNVETYASGLKSDRHFACHTRSPKAVESTNVSVNDMCVGYVLARINDHKSAHDPVLKILENLHTGSESAKHIFPFPVYINFIKHHTV